MKLAGGDELGRELNAQRIRMNDDKIRSLFLIFLKKKNVSSLWDSGGQKEASVCLHMTHAAIR